MEANKNNIDDRLWEFIDGQSSMEEKSAIENLIETNKQWKEKYHELLELHQLVQSSTLEEPLLMASFATMLTITLPIMMIPTRILKIY